MNHMMDEHLTAAFIENVQFLREAGLGDELICSQLKVSKDVFEKRLERAGISLGRGAA